MLPLQNPISRHLENNGLVKIKTKQNETKCRYLKISKQLKEKLEEKEKLGKWTTVQREEQCIPEAHVAAVKKKLPP